MNSFACRLVADDGTVVDVSDNVDISKLTVGKRVTLLSDSYKLEKMLPSSVDPLDRKSVV